MQEKLGRLLVRRKRKQGSYGFFFTIILKFESGGEGTNKAGLFIEESRWLHTKKSELMTGNVLEGRVRDSFALIVPKWLFLKT